MHTLTEKLSYLQEQYLNEFTASYTPGRFDSLMGCKVEMEHCPALLAIAEKYAKARAAGDEFGCACLAFASTLVNVAEVGE